MMIARLARQSRLAFAFTLTASVLAPAALFAQDTGRPNTPIQPEGDAKAADNAPDAAKESDKPKSIPVDLSSPRATMRTFLLAVQEADGDKPERIDDAVKCLDTSGLEEEGRDDAARALARRLRTLIDRIGVKLDDIPAETDQSEYVFHEVAAPDGGPAPAITLELDFETATWRFTAGTLEAIPALEEATKEKVAAETTDTAVPAARRTPRATMATFLNAMNAKPPDIAAAVECLDDTGQDPEAWSVRGKELAVKLKNVMDKVKLVVLPEVPDTPEGEPYVWHTSDTGNIVIGRIAEGKHAGEWRFTPKTLETLEALYLSLESKGIIQELREAGVKEQLTLGMRLQRSMPDWAREEYLQLQGWQWVALTALVAVGWLIKIAVTALVTALVKSWFRRRHVQLDAWMSRRALRWSGAVARAIFWYYAIRYFDLPAGLLKFMLPALRLVIAVTLVWFGYRLVDVIGSYIASNKEVRLTHFDDLLVPLLRTILRALVAVVVILFVFEWMGYTPTTVLGALGIGGFALAFAAQDTLGNFFGSLTVLFDRPFGIGDWVVIGDVEGTVERVGFRSTRVRTFYNSVITIPNSKMANTHVDNYGARRYRRTKAMLSLTYSTPPEKIDAFCEGVRELIRLHPYTRKDYYHVYFNQFSGSSLDVLLYVFFEAPDWGTELRERHHLYVDILRLADRLGVEFAFPTQTIWLERTREAGVRADRPPLEPGTHDPAAVGLDEAARLYCDVYGPEPPPRGPVVITKEPLSRLKQREDQNEKSE